MIWSVYISILGIVSLPCTLAYRIERQAVTEALEVEPTEALEQEWPITQPAAAIVTTPSTAFGQFPNVPGFGPISGVVNRRGQAGPALTPNTAVGAQGIRGAGLIAPVAPAVPAGGELEVETPEFEATNPPPPSTARQTAAGFFDPMFGFFGPTTPGGLDLFNFYFQTTVGSLPDQSIAIAPGRPGLTGPDPIVIGDVLGIPNAPGQRGNVIDVTAGRSQIAIDNQVQYNQGLPLGAPLSSTNTITRSRTNVPPANNIGPGDYLQINTRPGPQYGQGQISARSDGIAVDYMGSIQGPVQAVRPYSSNSQPIQQAGPAIPSNQRQNLVSNVAKETGAARPAPQNIRLSSGPVQITSQSTGTANLNQNVLKTVGPINSAPGVGGGRQSSGPISNNVPVSRNQAQTPDSSGRLTSIQGPRGVVSGNKAITQEQSVVNNIQGSSVPGRTPQSQGTVQTTKTSSQSHVVIQSAQSNQAATTSQTSQSNQTSKINQNSQTPPGTVTTQSETTVEPHQGHWVFEASRSSHSAPGPIRGQWVFQTALGTPSGGPAPISGQWVFEPEAGAVRNGTAPIRGQWVFKPDPVQRSANRVTQPLTTTTLPENTVPPQTLGAAQPTGVSQQIPQGNLQSSQGTSVRRVSSGNVANVYKQPSSTAGSNSFQVQGQGSISVLNQITLAVANPPGAVDVLPAATTPPPLTTTSAAVPTIPVVTTPAPVTEAIEVEPTEALEIEPTPAPDVPPAPVANVPPTTIPDTAKSAVVVSLPGSSGQPGPTGATVQGNVVAVQPTDVAQVQNGSPQPSLTVVEAQSANVSIIDQPPVNQQAVNAGSPQTAQVPSINSQSFVSLSQTNAAKAPSVSQTKVVWPQAGPVLTQP